MNKIILRKKPIKIKPLAVVKVVLKRKLQNELQLFTDEEIELASIAASYYAITFPDFEDSLLWKSTLEDTEWLTGRGHKMINGPYAWLNEPDFTSEELSEYFEQKG